MVLQLAGPRGLIQERSPAFLHRSVLRGQVLRPSQVISARTEVLHEMPESFLKVVRIFLWLMRLAPNSEITFCEQIFVASFPTHASSK